MIEFHPLRLTFGKHDWFTVQELSSNYLVWLAGQAFPRFKHPHLYADVLEELVSRAKDGRLQRDLRAKLNCSDRDLI